VNPRTSAAILAGKIAAAASRMSGRGGGTAIAGLAALRVDPAVVSRLASQAGAGSIAVTGTNGKTTTSLMLSRIAVDAGLLPLHNRSGSNMMRGIAAMLVEESSISGEIKAAQRRIAILEVDEATLPEAVRDVRPRVIVFTNLFRDQLDRYGEVDAVARSWRDALNEQATSHATIVLNADDPAVAHLGRSYRGPVLYYGVEDTAVGGDAVDHASDFRQCLECGTELAYSTTFYGHIGHWSCLSCGNKRPTPDIRARRVTLGDDSLALDVELPDGALRIAVPLSGLYNAYNALAAIACSHAARLPREATVAALEGFHAAFGRQERFFVDGRDVHVLLGKNPTGLNQVLRTLSARAERMRLLFFLNDGIADGRDISWIWDADYEIVQSATDWVLAAGTRAEDLALRLKYAGFGDDVGTERSTAAALRQALTATPEGKTLFVIPTYTAMLEVRELLAKGSGASRFWEDA
jgi:UDP-N-acetylmuramyl tripeptide synthase